MSLRVWLPLNGDLKNIGLENVTATTTGTTIDQNGKIGSCYKFGTGGSDITIPKEAMTSFTTEATVCFWLKIISWQTNYSTFFQAGPASTPWTSYVFGFLRNNNNSTCCFTISNGSTASNASYLTPTFDLDKWYHVVLVYKTGHCLIYINGELYKDYSTSIIPNFSNITTIKIGRSANGSSYQTNCQMNDFRIYDHAVDALEVKKIAQGLIMHLPLHNNGRGLPNLLKRTPRNHDSDAYLAYQFNLTENLQAGQTYTLQLWNVDVYHSAKSAAGTGISLYWGGGSVCIFRLLGPSYFYKNSDTNYRADYIKATVTITEDWAAHSNAANAWLNVYNSPGSATGTRNMKIGAWKLEKGTVATPYNFTTVDDEYSDFSLSTLVEYDISGYEYNGVRDETLSLFADTPVYSLSTVFDATKNNYIKIDSNKWMSQGMEEMTVNVWVKPTAAFSKFFSCTESGGWNIEGGDSGYLRFPVHVYTNEEKTSMTYKYDSKELLKSDIPQNEWTMISLVYDNTGTKTYINGELHHTYSYVSYGIHYNRNARLFLGCEATTTSPTTPYFTGQMSDFRIYATALSAEEIKELYGMR